MQRRTFSLVFAFGILAPVWSPVSRAQGQTDTGIDLEAALAPRVLGDPNAPVTLAEYFSLTCSHCAKFHNEVFPQLRETYVDTGRLKVELRDFPLDQWALRAAAIARCLPARHYAAMIDVLFKQQTSWAHAVDPGAALLHLAQLAGSPRDRSDACMKNEELLNGIIASRVNGSQQHNISSTPSFLLNGKKIEAWTVADFERLLAEAGA